MVLARKSAVGTRDTWSRLNSHLPLENRLEAPLSSAKISAEPPSVTSKRQQRQRRTLKNLVVSHSNGPAVPISVKESGKQQVSKINSSSNVSTPVMSGSGAAPVWLIRLSICHRYSSIATFLFVVATLAVYGWTVYSQELWSQAYRRLQNLHRYQRQLTTTNATLTNKLAEEAEQPTAGLVSPSPEGTIFLAPASRSPNRKFSTIPNSEIQLQHRSPLGY